MFHILSLFILILPKDPLLSIFAFLWLSRMLDYFKTEEILDTESVLYPFLLFPLFSFDGNVSKLLFRPLETCLYKLGRLYEAYSVPYLRPIYFNLLEGPSFVLNNVLHNKMMHLFMLFQFHIFIKFLQFRINLFILNNLLSKSLLKVFPN